MMLEGLLFGARRVILSLATGRHRLRNDYLRRTARWVRGFQVQVTCIAPLQP